MPVQTPTTADYLVIEPTIKGVDARKVNASSGSVSTSEF